MSNTSFNETCDEIWSKLIVPTFMHMETSMGEIICPESDKQVFQRHLEEIINHAKSHYMSDDITMLNRHKNAAAVMIAVLKTKPIKKLSPMFYQEDKNGKVPTWPLNESLAITVALSILRTYIIERSKYAFGSEIPVDKSKYDGVTKQDVEIFKDGIPSLEGVFIVIPCVAS